MKETLKQARYKYIGFDPNSGLHVLQNDSGGLEAFVSNKNHASWGLIFRNTHLEFVTSDPSYFFCPDGVEKYWGKRAEKLNEKIRAILQK